jgi:hypothetical protein
MTRLVELAVQQQLRLTAGVAGIAQFTREPLIILRQRPD